MQDIFSENGTKYQVRSNSMLEYTSDNILQGLEKSFEIEPIRICEILKGKYLINVNGRHRYSVLKIHYLSQLSKCKTSDEIYKLKLKYTIPVIVEELDVIKTYSQYLLHIINPNLIMEEEIKNSLRTGSTVIEDENGKLTIYTDKELLQYLKKTIDTISKSKLKNNISEIYANEEYFREYIDNNFNKII